MNNSVYWLSEAPVKCQLSERVITTQFVDGRVPGIGGWALMHPTEFLRRNGVYGPGTAQRFVKQEDGRWLKVEGCPVH